MIQSAKVPASVHAVLALGAPANAIILNDVTIDGYRQRQQELLDASNAIVARADAEKRELTADENREIDANTGEFDRLDAEIDRRARVAAQQERMTQPRPRQTEPDPIDADDPPAPSIAAAAQRPAPPALPARAQPQPRITAAGTYGFRSFGDYAQAVRNGSLRGGSVDPRLIRGAAAGTISTESIGADGGFAVPPDFRIAIMEKVFGEASLLARTPQIPVTGNTLTMPVDMSTPWQTTGGIQAYWEGEVGAITQSKVALEQVSVRAHKLVALVPVSEELLEDAGALDAYLRRKAPAKLDFKIANAIVRGTGAGQPLGFLNSPVLVTVAAEGSQVADTIVAGNCVKMYAAMPTSSRSTAVWLIHPDAEPQLPLMSIGNQPVWLPPGGLSQSPLGMLLGRPVIPHQVCETVGDLGDIMLVDLSQYLTIVKSGGVRTNVSMHLWFDQDLVAYKFTIRVGGQPWWSSTTASRDGSFVQSPFVVLAARA